MSSSDSRQTRFANTNANARRPGNWGSDPAREYRPIGQRYGSVLVLSGPKRKQSGPTVRKPVPRPVNLPSQRKDRQAEGSLLGGKQTRAEDSAQSENTAQSLNSHTWHNSTGTWTSPQESSHRTDEYGFPIRSEAPINAREFPSLAASKQAPSGKKTSQQDQADAYFSLDDRDTLPPADSDSYRAFGARDDRADGPQDWRSGRGDPGPRDEEGEGTRPFPGSRNPESRRGAFGFNTTDGDRRGGAGSSGYRSRSGGSGAFSGRIGARLEDYGMRPGSSPGADKGSPRSRPGDDYVGPAAQVLGASNTLISSTLLGSSVAGPAAGAQGDDDDDEEEDEELQRHYNELEAIKQEEEEKSRQRVLLGAEGSSVDAFAEDGDEGGTWEDAAAADDTDSVKADDDMGLKPINHEKWQQRQAELEEEDRRRRERAEAKKRELEEAILRREEIKQRAAREASEAALAALAAANAPLPLQQPPQIVPPPPPPPPRNQAPASSNASAAGYDVAQGFTGEAAPVLQEAVPCRPELIPAPAPAQPAWTQSLYTREAPKAPVDIIVPPPPPPPRAESSQGTIKSVHQDGWHDEWHGEAGHSHVGREAGRGARDGARESRADALSQGRGRGRRAEGHVRAGEGRAGRSRPSTSALTTPGSNTPQASSRGEGHLGDAGSTTASATASDADAAAVAAAAKVAKAMEGYGLALPSVLAAKGISKDGGSKNSTSNGVDEISSSTSPPLAATAAAQDESALYSSYGSGAALMPASDAVHTLERMDKRGSMFDGKEDGEDLLPSNIFGGDDAPYSGVTGKSSSTGVVPTRPSPLLPLHDTAFGPALAPQSKSVAGSVHVSRAFSSPDHPNALPLGSPAAFGAPPQSHQSVRDRLPDDVPLWGRSHDWAPPPPPASLHHSSDLHLHTPSFHPGDVSTYMPSTAPAQPATTSNPPPSFNAFGYPSSTYSSFGMQQPPYSLNAVFQQPTQPLLPTSKPPDWSNNAHSGLAWPSVPPPVASHPNSVHPVMTSDNQQFAMRPTAAHGAFQPKGATAQAPSIPVTHAHQRRVDVEVTLPDTLGLGSSGPKVSMNAKAAVTPAPSLSGNSNPRSGRGSRGSRGGNGSAPPPPPPRNSGGRGDGNQPRSRGPDAERQGQSSGGGGGGSRRQGSRSGRGRGQGRRGRERAEAGPPASASAV